MPGDLFVQFLQDELLGLRGRDDATPTASRTWHTPGQLARDLDPTTRQTPALDLVDQALVDVDAGVCDRLMIFMPPQEGKSTRVTKVGPVWMLTRNPSRRIVVVSYNQDLANEFGRDIRGYVNTNQGVDGSLDVGLRIARDNGSVSSWRLEGHRGGVRSVGIGGGLTGRPADCVSGDTYIQCERGRITAEEAHFSRIRRILAYDHTTDQPVWRDVEATRRIPSRQVIEIVTAAGRVLTCTPDHRVYTGRGYVPAGSLRHGDALVSVVAPGRVPVRQPASRPESRLTQGDHPGPVALLHAGMCAGGSLGDQSDAVLRLRAAGAPEQTVDLLDHLSASTAAAAEPDLPRVPPRVPPSDDRRGLLLAPVRGHGALPADDRPGQWPVQGRQELREVVPVDETADPGTRSAPVCGVQRQPHHHVRPSWPADRQIGIDRAPHRPRPPEQHPGEPHHVVHDVPRRAPQLQHDTVAMVRRGSGQPVDVYDFQVAGTRNFFADGVLVHNCMIIDDPIRNRTDAESEVYRQRAKDFWTSTATTRLAPGAPVVIILTRWHADDLAGWLLGREDADRWRVINIPAQANHDPAQGETDPLGRDPGEYLASARVNESTGQSRTAADWEKIRIQAGSRDWEALYQGNPSPPEGGILKRAWWRFYEQPLWVERSDGSRVVTGDDLLLSWDMAFKDTDGSDYVVGQAWLRRGADAYLLDQTRARLGFPSTCLALRQMAARWPQATLKLVEDKANGTAVIASLRRLVPGIVPVEPDGSKLARASAVAPLVEAGNVYLPAPELAPWVGDFVEECAGFPNAAHDDQVDALSQGLNRLVLQPLQAGLIVTQDDLDEELADFSISPY